MYYYLVDPKQYDGKNFEFHQSQLLALLGEHHIAGETARVTKLRTVDDLVATALSHNATTLVVVGGDETFSRVVSVARGKSITLGYISINSRSELARILGIGALADAVATIAKRRVETLDLAKIGDTYFISNVYFGTAAGIGQAEESTGFLPSLKRVFQATSMHITLTIDGSFKVSDGLFAGSIVNARDRSVYPTEDKTQVGNPKDHWLDIVLASKLTGLQQMRYRKELAARCFELTPGGSVMHAHRVEIAGPEGLPVYLAGEVVARAPVMVEMTKEKIRVVVGKTRQF